MRLEGAIHLRMELPWTIFSREQGMSCSTHEILTCNHMQYPITRCKTQRMSMEAFAKHSTAQRCKHSSVMQRCILPTSSNVLLYLSACWCKDRGIGIAFGKSDRCNSRFRKGPRDNCQYGSQRSTLWRRKCALRYAKTPEDRSDGLEKTHHSCSEQWCKGCYGLSKIGMRQPTKLPIELN